jgi:hypothetical protein
MRPSEKGALVDVFGECLVYRSLVPADSRLPTIHDLREQLRLGPGILPRKAEPDYARVVGAILIEARRIAGIAEKASRLIYVGDTMHNDVAAFSNLCEEMEWQGRAFIADERSEAPQEFRWLADGRQLTVSNEWKDISPFWERAADDGFGCDSSTVVVADIDKTLLGARGRNDHVIDQARQQAAYEVVCDSLGQAFVSRSTFVEIYDSINNPSLHALTEDNQDAVAYTSVLVSCGLFDLDSLRTAVAKGDIVGIDGLADDVERKRGGLPQSIALLHDAVREQVIAGNPTPFVAFREAEFRCTARLMGHLPEDASRQSILDDEIAITEEVWTVLKAWKAKGCIVFGLSDKPDEACYPSCVASGSQELPLHCLQTHIVGGRR